VQPRTDPGSGGRGYPLPHDIEGAPRETSIAHRDTELDLQHPLRRRFRWIAAVIGFAFMGLIWIATIAIVLFVGTELTGVRNQPDRACRGGLAVSAKAHAGT
jgi:hypothetical protein